MAYNDLLKNTVKISDDVRICKSKKKEQNLLSSDQVFRAGVTVVVTYDNVGYARLTDGINLFKNINNIGSSGGSGGSVSWNDVTDKPIVIAAGSNQADARAAIGAGTSSLTIGTTASTAAAGNHTHNAATTSAPGFMSAADKTKLDGIANGATANDTNANLLNRANHTGVQDISTITNLQESLDEKVDNTVLTAALPSTVGTTGQVLKSDGTNVTWQTDTNTTYSEISQANVENPASTTVGLITGQRAAQAVAANESLKSIVAGTNVSVDVTDPKNPVINVSGSGGSGITSVVAGDNISVDNTDPDNPIISATGTLDVPTDVIRASDYSGDWTQTSGAVDTEDPYYNIMTRDGDSSYHWIRKITDNEVQATWFGVVGDYNTDCTAQLQLAINYCIDNALKLILPPGVICISDTIYINRNPSYAGFRIIGQGFVANNFGNKAGTKIMYMGEIGTLNAIFEVTDDDFYTYFEFSDFEIQSRWNDGAAIGFYVSNSSTTQFTFRNVRIGRCTTAFMINEGTGANSEFYLFDHCGLYGTQYAYRCNADQALSVKFIDCSTNVYHGGIIYDFIENAGGTFISTDNSSTAYNEWQASTSYEKSQYMYTQDGIWRASNAGTSGTVEPSGTSDFVDNDITWTYIRQFTGTTLIRVGEYTHDTMAFYGGRNEGVSRVAWLDNTSQQLFCSFTGVSFTIKENIENANFLEGVRIDGSGIVTMRDCNFTIAGSLDDYPLQPFYMNAYGNSGKILVEDCTFIGLTPKGNAYISNSLSPSGTAGLNQNSISVKNSLVKGSMGGGFETLSLNNNIVPDTITSNKKSFRGHNLLLQSKYGEAVSGSNVSAVSPWVHTGSLSFVSVSNLTDTGINPTAISKTGKRITLGANSSVYQDISLDITGENVYLVIYEALVTLNGLGSVRFSLESSNGQVFDDVTLTLGYTQNNGYRRYPVKLVAFIPADQTGTLRLVQQNPNSGNSPQIDIYWQYVSNRLDAAFIETTTTEVEDTLAYEDIKQSVKITDMLTLPETTEDYLPPASTQKNGLTVVSGQLMFSNGAEWITLTT